VSVKYVTKDKVTKGQLFISLHQRMKFSVKTFSFSYSFYSKKNFFRLYYIISVILFLFFFFEN